MIGKGDGGANWARRVMACVLAVAMALGTVPAGAVAEGLEELSIPEPKYEGVLEEHRTPASPPEDASLAAEPVEPRPFQQRVGVWAAGRITLVACEPAGEAAVSVRAYDVRSGDMVGESGLVPANDGALAAAALDFDDGYGQLRLVLGEDGAEYTELVPADLGDVTGLVVEARDGNARVAWDAVQGADGYAVCATSAERSDDVLFFCRTEGTSADIDGLPGGKAATVRVAAFRGEDGAQAFGRAASAEVPTTSDEDGPAPGEENGRETGADGAGSSESPMQLSEGEPRTREDGAAADGEDRALSTQSLNVSNPRKVPNSSMRSGQVVTWDCVWLGSYPQHEIFGSTVYDSLESASWSNGDAIVDGVRYRRVEADDATYSGGWPAGDYTYRYFRYDPIKWRVLEVSGNKALVVADKVLDCRPYNNAESGCTWETSTIRSWLNATGGAPYYDVGAQNGNASQGFSSVAFTSDEVTSAILDTSVRNADNTKYGTDGGNDTQDKIFLLSESDVHGSLAGTHGFVSDPDIEDEARVCGSTWYAICMGLYDYLSISWWLRTPGRSWSSGAPSQAAAAVNSDGSVSLGGSSFHHYGKYNTGIRPAMNINLSSPLITYAGTVSSNGSVEEITDKTITSVTLAEDSYLYDGTAKRPAVTVMAGNNVVPASGYNVTYANNVEAGTAIVTVIGKGGYTGSVSATFEIVGCELASVTMTRGDGTSVDVLSQSATANVSNPDATFSFAARLTDRSPSASGFLLYQLEGDTRRTVARAGASGNFGSVGGDALVSGLDTYVVVYDANGKAAQTKRLLLTVDETGCELSAANVLLEGKITNVLEGSVTLDTLDSAHVIDLALNPKVDGPRIKEAKLYQQGEGDERVIATMGPTAKVSGLRSSLFEPGLPCYVRLTSERGIVTEERLNVEVEEIGYEIGSVTLADADGFRDVLQEACDVITPQEAWGLEQLTIVASLAGKSKTATRYTLYQYDGSKRHEVATAGPDGRFEVSNDDFEPDMPCYVSVTGKSGKVEDYKKLLITVVDGDYPTYLEIGGGKIVLGDWPWDGVELEIPDVKCPLKLTFSHGRFQAGYNVGSEDEIHNLGTLPDTSKLERLKSLLMGTAKPVSGGKITSRGDVAIYLEGDVRTGMTRAFLMLKYTLSAEGQWQLPPPVPFMVVAVEGEGSLTNTWSSGMRWKGGKVVSTDVGLGYGGEFSLGGSLGLGLANVANAGIYGIGRLGITGTSSLAASASGDSRHGIREVYVSGDLGVRVYLVGVKLSFPFVQSDKRYLYRRVGIWSQASDDGESLWDVLRAASEADYEPVDRSYLNQTSAWSGHVDDGGPSRLQADVYPDAQVSCADVAGGKLMAFLSDDASRGGANRSVLMWSRYDAAGATWSDPLPVWQDGTADFLPSVCADGSGGAWVTWSNARQALGDDTTPSDRLSSLDVSVAHIGADGTEFEAQDFLSDGTDAYEAHPRVGMSGSTPVVAWSTNAPGDPFGMGDAHDVVAYANQGGSWQQLLSTGVSGVVGSLDAGGLGGPAVCWTTDADCDLGTTGDSSAYAWTRGQVTQLAAGGAWNTRFATAGGEEAVAWCAGGTLTYAPAGGLGAAVATPLEGVPAISFDLCGDVLGDALLSYRRYGENLSNVYGIRAEGGQWGAEIPLTDQGQTITSFSASLSDGRPTVAYAASTETADSSTDAGIWYVEPTGIESCRIHEACYDSGTLLATVTNVGSVALDEVTLVVSEAGVEVARKSASVSLAPGASGLVTVDDMDQLADGSEHSYEVRVEPCGPLAPTASLSVERDVRLDVSLSHEVAEGGECFSCVVRSAGENGLAGGICTFADAETGEELYREEFEGVAPGEFLTITYDPQKFLWEDGVSSVVAKVTNAEGEVLAERVTSTWEGAYGTEPDPDAPGADDKQAAQITASDKSLKVGQTVALGASVTEGAGGLSYTSLDQTVVMVDEDGTLTGVGAGTATVIVRAEANDDFFSSSKDVSVTVSQADIAQASISAIPDQTYTGKALAPKPKVTLGDATLREGTDYALSYRDNINPGTATVTVTGKGGYSGTKSATFKIVARTFPDVPANAWYAGVVSRAVGLGLINGYGNGKFGPNDKITRGQVAVILWNMAGGPEASAGARTFPDVKSDVYYYRAVRWASSVGVVSGYGNSNFGPNDNVTREQLAAMLASYAKQVAKRPVSGSKSDFASMRDKDKVSDWAVSSVGWCFKSGILSGSGGNVNPHGSAARAEAAKMVVGLYDMLT